MLVAGEDHVDLRTALDALAARGLRHVVCEGGPTLLSAVLAAGVVDELALTLAPTVVGGDGTRTHRAERHSARRTASPCVATLLVEEAGTLLGLWRVRR